MRTWKGVLTIRSPLSTSPAIRETDGAQSFSPEVAEVSRDTGPTCRAFSSPAAWHSMHYPACSGQACPPDAPLLSLLSLCALAPPDSSEHIKHATSFRASGPHVVSFAWSAIPCPVFLGNSSSPFKLSFYSTLREALPDRLRTEFVTPSSDCPLHRGSIVQW